jgi:hypothetical protein
LSRQKERKYYPDKTYKVTIVENNDNRTEKYFKGDEMEEVEMKIKNKVSKIKYWFIETLTTF